MDRIVNEIDHGVRTVATLPVTVHELVWHSDARSFEVHRVDTGEDLTGAGCFDTMPTDHQIADRIVHHMPSCDRVDGASDPVGDVR
jgi:hypothetical protein